MEVLGGEAGHAVLEVLASTTPKGLMARLGLEEEEVASLKILGSEEFLVEEWPLLDYHTLRQSINHHSSLLHCLCGIVGGVQEQIPAGCSTGSAVWWVVCRNRYL